MNRKCWFIAASGLLAVLLATLGGILGRNFSSLDDGNLVRAEEPAKKATTWPMFGGTPQRNMVNIIDKNIPIKWKVDEGKQENIKWVVELGSASYGGPVIADGKVFVGTNNANPRDKKIEGKDKAILMAFNEADGKFLWQIVHDIPDDEAFHQAKEVGLCSTPIVEGKRLYYVTPGCEVVCADTSGKTQWIYDMRKELKVVPHHLSNCSPLIVGDLVMVITGNGVNDEGKLPSPKAPSFVAINKNTGKLAWQSNLPGEKILEGQWSNPTLATVNGKNQVIFAGGDCVIYSFEPEKGTLLWKCNCNPTPKKKEDREFDNYIVATPVVVGDKLYVGLGPYPGHPVGSKFSYVVCLDITKTGDVSPKSFDAKAAANKNSALVWAFGGPIVPLPQKAPRRVFFGSTISTAAVHEGLVYMAEERGYLHCLDAKTGQRYWDHDFQANVWGSAYCVDGKVYTANEDGDVVIFEQGKTRKKLATVSLDESTHGTPVVAGGVLYIATKSKLYAIANGK
jgi:outer membrane protein assembly factor BamB